MPLEKLELANAAKLLIDTRAAILKGNLGNQLKRVSQPGRNVDAGLTRDHNTLVVTGSSGMTDYLFYNLRPFRPLPDMPEIDQLIGDLPKRAFHKGFLLHAARILRFLGDDRPDFITGHSLGAASAQILGTALGVPTICFAPPQVIKRRFLKRPEFRDPNHPQWNVYNLAWKQDFVTHGYRHAGMRCLGHRTVVDFGDKKGSIEHFVKDYHHIVISDSLSPTPQLPPAWPDSDYELPTRLA